jgi:hypothetical protein
MDTGLLINYQSLLTSCQSKTVKKNQADHHSISQNLPPLLPLMVLLLKPSSKLLPSNLNKMKPLRMNSKLKLMPELLVKPVLKVTPELPMLAPKEKSPLKPRNELLDLQLKHYNIFDELQE